MTGSPPESPCRLEALGMIGALGANRDEIWPRILAGDRSGLRPRDGFLPGGPMVVGAVDAPLPGIPEALAHYDCRNNAFTLAALEEIAEPVRDATRRFGAERIGVVMGTSTSGSAECEAAILNEHRTGELLPSFRYSMLEFGATAGFVAHTLGLRGPALTISTACSSSARSIASARSLLRLGICDAVIAGGSDSLCGLTTNGFASLQAVANEASNPMSANRKGLTLGEGAALFLMTREPGGIQLVGVGESTEAHHMSAPDPEGGGAIRSMRGALAEAGATPSDVLYLNLHGTGTQLNDAMESRAVDEVLGRATPSSSTKSLVGHTLGAAGATELAFLWLALDDAQRNRRSEIRVPPHVFDGERDPELPEVALTSPDAAVAARPGGVLLSNSFGFGGNNCTLALRDDSARRPSTQIPVEERRMPRVRVRAWSAWSPGLEERADWQRWSENPGALASEGVPKVDFLPASVRRRCTRLTKMMLRAAFDACDEELRSRVPTVFASRHGAIHVAVKILATIARQEIVSPMQFSHSVHNAQAGLFSIAAGNREASSSMAAEEDTFAAGFLEAMLLLDRSRDRPVLLVAGDEPVPDNLSHLTREPPGAYGAAFLIECAEEDDVGGIEFSLGSATGADTSPPETAANAPPARWPQAAEFLRWLESGEPELALGERCVYRWARKRPA